MFIFFLKNLRLIQNLKYIFLHKELRNFYNVNTKKSVVLDDAANIESFKNIKVKKIKKTCVYIGSFLRRY